MGATLMRELGDAVTFTQPKGIPPLWASEDARYARPLSKVRLPETGDRVAETFQVSGRPGGFVLKEDRLRHD
jgi:hypothetical protein